MWSIRPSDLRASSSTEACPSSGSNGSIWPFRHAPAAKPAPSSVPAPPRLSIVVLPLANIGGDPEQEHFVDGVTESLTTDLSRIRGSSVIGRSTAFTYKGLGDVLELYRAEIVDGEIEPALDLPVGLLGKTDGPRFRDALKPGGDVDPATWKRWIVNVGSRASPAWVAALASSSLPKFAKAAARKKWVSGQFRSLSIERPSHVTASSSARRCSLAAPAIHTCTTKRPNICAPSRQREGIAKAKAENRYMGRRPSARLKADEAVKLFNAGRSVTDIATALNIGRGSVYRALEAAGRKSASGST